MPQPLELKKTLGWIFNDSFQPFAMHGHVPIHIGYFWEFACKKYLKQNFWNWDLPDIICRQKFSNTVTVNSYIKSVAMADTHQFLLQYPHTWWKRQ